MQDTTVSTGRHSKTKQSTNELTHNTHIEYKERISHSISDELFAPYELFASSAGGNAVCVTIERRFLIADSLT
jgi:hypothetical protein